MADAPSPPADDARRILVVRAASALDAARQAGGDVPPGETEALERLARLLAVHAAAAAAPPRRSWQLAIVGAATLAVVSLLLFARMGRTEIDLEIEATEAGFTIGAEQVVVDAADLALLGVSGLARIRVPREVATALQGIEVVDEADVAIALEAKQVNGRRGAIGLNEIRPARATAVGVQAEGRGDRFRVRLQDPGITIDVGVVGPVEISISGLGSAVVDFAAPQGLVLEPAAAGGVELTLAFRDAGHAALAAQMPVSTLAFWRVDEPADRRLATVRSVSTILGGAVYLEELDGAKRPLRAGEILRFERVEGDVRALRLRDDRLSLGFHGRVWGMSTAAAPRVRSLMPTWLEWLGAQHGLSLLWGTTLYLAGLAVAALRWFKGPL